MAFRVVPDKSGGLYCWDDTTGEHAVCVDEDEAREWFTALDQKHKDDYARSIAPPETDSAPEAFPATTRFN
jgi:glucose dehydrogenase